MFAHGTDFLNLVLSAAGLSAKIIDAFRGRVQVDNGSLADLTCPLLSTFDRPLPPLPGEGEPGKVGG